MKVRITSRAGAAFGITLAAATLGACGGGDSSGGSDRTTAALPQGSEHVELDPSEFTTEIDNPYFPMSPGSRWVFEETDTDGMREKVVVVVTDKTKMIANGIEAVVVRDTASTNGEPLEVTDDWYAQDASGSIWYLGEDTAEYKDGEISSTAGSFEAGVAGAEPGIAVPANPEPGMSYRQEYLEGEAEDTGAVITVGEERVQVPFGYFSEDVLMTRDLVPLEPKVQELKFYAPGVGPLLSVHTDGAGGRASLISYTAGEQAR